MSPDERYPLWLRIGIIAGGALVIDALAVLGIYAVFA